MRSSLLPRSLSLVSLFALAWLAPSASTAKSHGKSCAAAVAAFQATGVGDSDGDGIPDCVEKRQLHTDPNNPDTDGDGIPDGVEIEQHTDALSADSDDDGIDDADDDTPEIPEQKVDAFLDAISCPTPGVPGSISALGMTAILDDLTEFEGLACADLVTQLGTDPHLRVEINVIEDISGAITAREVESEGDQGNQDNQGPPPPPAS